MRANTPETFWALARREPGLLENMTGDVMGWREATVSCGTPHP